MVFDVQMAIYGTTVALNLSLSVAVGAVLAVLWLARETTAWPVAQLRNVRPVRIGATFAALVAMGLLLPFVSASIAEVPLFEAGEATGAMLTESHFGMAWAIGMGALVAAASTALVPSKQWMRSLAVLNLIALAVALYTRSMVSHAAADGDLSLAVVVDWIHLCLTSVWVGEVFLSALVTLRGRVPAHAADRAQVARYIENLSSSATFALVGLFATGVFSAWHNLGSVAALTGHSYGSLLLLKLGLVALAVLLGGLNRFIVMPSLLAGLRAAHADAAAPLRRFTLNLRIEALVLLAVLIAAAFLSATSPPTSG